METIRRRDLFRVWLEKKGCSKATKLQHVKAFALERTSPETENSSHCIKQCITRFCAEVYSRWIKSKANVTVFEKQNMVWLSKPLLPSSPTLISTGRPKKSFKDLNERNKRRRVEPIRCMGSARELSFAAVMNARNEGLSNV